MNATQVDPRTVAATLRIGTDDLARLLTNWASDALPSPDYDKKWEPMALEAFDLAVDTARTYLVEAHAAQNAWEEDNPAEPETA